MTTKSTLLKLGENTFTEDDLIRKAAVFKGLKYCEGGSSIKYSEAIIICELDPSTLAYLEKHRIKRHQRTDDIFTLSDENPQEVTPGWAPSCYWNFKKKDGRYDLKVSLNVQFRLSHRDRGIIAWPVVHTAGSGVVSASDPLPNFRLFKGLVEHHQIQAPIALELVQSGGFITITWTDLELRGLRSLPNLFEEFSKGNQTLQSVACHQSIFDPPPRQQRAGSEILYISEPTHPRLFDTWHKQIEEYRRALAV